MIAKEQRIKIAKERFLSAHPELQHKLLSLSSTDADSLAMSLEEYRDIKLNQEFNQHAKTQGMNASDLVIDLCAENELEKQVMYQEQEVISH
ncbi:hypothetical protein SG34_009420 [Thalassomonas viridans]|uniref:Uncharacterized protein n=1 Tax=Thalassomonas viridans TaxID=137584 RepID=A0AAE9Z8K7_9GAMM|nr:DUF6388 family protein [Thalassomonas viridans]WDE07082.1 hypothetical protein SG34_009420 [Thalassomonas viridans]